MAANNKIEQMGLSEIVLELHGQGLSTATISERLKQDHGDKAPSQRTVARFLQDVRKERRSETKAVVHDYVKQNVPADLVALDAVLAYFMDVFQNYDHNIQWIFEEYFKRLDDAMETANFRQEEITIKGMKEIFRAVVDASRRRGAGFDTKTRLMAGRDVISVITTKLKFAGVLDEDGEGPGSTLKSLLQEIDGVTGGIPAA